MLPKNDGVGLKFDVKDVGMDTWSTYLLAM